MDQNVPPIIAEPLPKTVEVEVLPPEPGQSAGFQKAQAAPLPSRKYYKVAMFLAVLADAIQIGLFPIFGPGFLSVADVILDVVAFALFWRLVGWHPALLPGLIFEQLPLIDLAPTWTLAVWIAIRRNSRTDPSEPIESKVL